MPSQERSRFTTLVRRELQESRDSLVWTPLAVAVILVLLMAVGVILSNRIGVLGDTLLQVILQEESIEGMSITIEIGEDGKRIETPDVPTPPPPSAAPQFRIEPLPGPVDEESWNFSREWNFTPKHPKDDKGEDGGGRAENLNPALTAVHVIFLLVLFLVTANYLLGSLYSDRKDRSILFWKSMPVSEWEEVLSKLAVAILVAPAIYIALSIVTQFLFTLLMMLLVQRMQLDPVESVLSNIELAPLLGGQIGGWLVSALWLLPSYAWLMLASAAARRSPFMLAITPVVLLAVFEGLVFGSKLVLRAVLNHVPHVVENGTSLGFEPSLPDLASLDYLGMALGLAFTGAALAGAVYLRRYRFEI